KRQTNQRYQKQTVSRHRNFCSSVADQPLNIGLLLLSLFSTSMPPSSVPSCLRILYELTSTLWLHRDALSRYLLPTISHSSCQSPHSSTFQYNPPHRNN